MAITQILIDEENEEIIIERATKEGFDTGMRQIEPDGEKGWLVAQILQKRMAELMRLSKKELQDMRLASMEADT